MQKALTQMNIQLANVLSDVSGMTGQAIIQAILAGERDPRKPAAFRDFRVKASKEQIARSLEGNWQEDLLFVLQQEQDGYEFCQKQMAECDRRLRQDLQQREDRSQGATLPEEKRKERLRKKKKGNAPGFDLLAQLFRMTGTDLGQIDGIDVTTDDDPPRSGMGYEQMGDRGPFRFLATAVSRQSNQRGQDHRERSAADQQQSNPRPKNGAQHLATQQQLFGGPVPSTQNQARSSYRDQGHGSQAGPTYLPHAALRNAIRRPWSEVLRGSTSQPTNQLSEMESR